MKENVGRCVTEFKYAFCWNGLAFTGSAHIENFCRRWRGR